MELIDRLQTGCVCNKPRLILTSARVLATTLYFDYYSVWRWKAPRIHRSQIAKKIHHGRSQSQLICKNSEAVVKRRAHVMLLQSRVQNFAGSFFALNTKQRKLQKFAPCKNFPLYGISRCYRQGTKTSMHRKTSQLLLTLAPSDYSRPSIC